MGRSADRRVSTIRWAPAVSPVADTLNSNGTDARRRAIAVTRGQTPQMFRIGVIADALACAGALVTDEANAVEARGLHPRLVTGDATNLKVTWPEEFGRAEALLASRATMHEGVAMNSTTLRLGTGISTLVTGRPLVLGGVVIPQSRPVYSDGDALCAITARC
jgi:hypothetical protein